MPVMGAKMPRNESPSSAGHPTSQNWRRGTCSQASLVRAAATTERMQQTIADPEKSKAWLETVAEQPGRRAQDEVDRRTGRGRREGKRERQQSKARRKQFGTFKSSLAVAQLAEQTFFRCVNFAAAQLAKPLATAGGGPACSNMSATKS